jgi:glycosyltransferase involved in cell wall biosynthesis
MKIALCAVQFPFERGGAELLCDTLYNELIMRDYEVEYVRIPFKWYPPEEIINNSLIWRLLDLSECDGSKIDCVIATKFPSYLVKHQNKVVWLLHQHRPAYDLEHTKFDSLSNYDKFNNAKIGNIVKTKIRYIDNKCLKESKKVYTIAQNVANRLWEYNGIHGEALYHPPPFMGKYYCQDYDRYIFYPSRLDPLKRQDLIIKSMKYVKNNIRLKIAGSGSRLNDYVKLAKDLNVEDKIDFLGYVSEERLLNLYANAFCIPYVPQDEDLGYVTLESFLSKKPVITCVDSGGPLEFVEDNVNGFILDPDPKKIAEKIDFIYENELGKQMGENGYKKVEAMNLSWDNVVRKLLETFG